MSLSQYRKKRSFQKTPEPVGGRGKTGELSFVVQKHAASHLHYDLRLEMKAVLKSWAIPKGPSIDPKIKRLAIMVEDHPYDYRKFEGIIPKGEYGGGTVIVWDEGFYEPDLPVPGSKKEKEKKLLAQLHKGKLRIRMHGKKLKGVFSLVKAAYRGDNSWLLMKMDDRYAGLSDISKKDKSVLTGRTIEQVEKEGSKGTGEKRSTKKIVKKKAVKKNPKKRKAGSPKKKIKLIGEKAPFPKGLTPMLATLADKPFDDEGWMYEIKWDGYRAVAFLRNGKADLRSRNNKSFNERFFPVQQALQGSGINAVLDGELIVAGKNGKARFGDLQNWRSEKDGNLLYYVFDLPWYEGYSLMQLPLTERCSKLEEILPEHPIIKLSPSFATSGTEFYQAAKKMDIEGIIAKKADSDYKPGFRTKEWLKIKTNKRQEVVIGGYTVNEGTGKLFSALLVGVYSNNKLIYTGKIGTGFTVKMQQEMMKQFKPLLTSIMPFAEQPGINKPSRFRPNPPNARVFWLKPRLVCEVTYTELTSDGIMRHPSFKGIRDDKKAREVILERPVQFRSKRLT